MADPARADVSLAKLTALCILASIPSCVAIRALDIDCKIGVSSSEKTNLQHRGTNAINSQDRIHPTDIPD